jgi:tetratricopeptide (TPR) repeat protein
MMPRIVILLALAVVGSEISSRAQTGIESLGFSFSSAPGIENSQEEKLYRLGTSAMNEGRWDAAADIFDEVFKQRGQRTVASLYWKAYALNKLGRSQEALKIIAELRKSYRQSEWLKDADALELEIKHLRGVAGGIVGSVRGGVGVGIGGGIGEGVGNGVGGGVGSGISPASNDEDLKLLALNSLMGSAPSRAIPVLKKLLESSNSPQMKERILFVLAQSNSPEAQALLLEAAKTQSIPELQRRAVAFMAAQPTTQHLAALEEIYWKSEDRMLRRAILEAYVSCGCRKELFYIARRETNPELRRHAIESLTGLGDREALLQLYKEAGSPADKVAIERSLVSETRRTVIDILTAMGGKDTLAGIFVRESDLQSKLKIIDSLMAMGAAKELIALDRREKDPRLHRKILEGLSNLNGSEVQDYMFEILNK